MDDALKAIVPVAAVEAPLNSDEELVAVYVLGDPHHGLLASKAETGTEWNLQKSIETQCAAADLLVAAAPSAATGLLVNLGDFFQTDTSENGANKGYFVYDVSNRQNEIIAAGVESLKYFVVKMLTKHRMVELVNVPGNHDGTSVVWLNIALTEAFRNNPRVTIHNQPVSTHYLTYGKCMIIATHGESTVMKKPEAFALQIASDAKVQWAATEYRHALVGHVHHQKVKEVTGVTIESFRSLTARDAHTHNEGYRAQREANCLVFHREFGLTQRIIKGIGEIEAAIERSKKASALN
jgi:predicted phosphodiesterase